MVNESVNGVAVVSDDGKRMAWQLDKRVIAQVKRFTPGDPVVVMRSSPCGPPTPGGP